MKILVACEESQRVTAAFRALGHEAFSCDMIPCSGGHPEWHIQGDVLSILKAPDLPYDMKGDIEFTTGDGTFHCIEECWDMMIAHPPCTYLSVSGLHWNKRNPERAHKTEEALVFVKKLMDAPINRIAIENPVSCISSRIRKPDQIIQPYEYGDDASKRTCLWLKNLPKLQPTKHIPPRMVNGKPRWSNQTDSGQNKLGPSPERAKERSKTYQGIANAIAQQWGQN